MAPDSALKRLSKMSIPGQWILAAIEGAMQSSGEGRHDPGFFHPSSLDADCDAYLGFRYLGAPAVEVIEAKTQRIYDYGNHREGYLQQYTKAAGISLINSPQERFIQIPDLHIRGEVDNWVINPITKHRFIIDYKTMRSDLWKALTEIRRGHHLQIHPYMFAKQTFNGFVIYENKDTQELKAMKGDFDTHMWRVDIVDRIHRILEGLERNIVYRNPVNCSRCPFFANGICTSNQIQKLREESHLWDQ